MFSSAPVRMFAKIKHGCKQPGRCGKGLFETTGPWQTPHPMCLIPHVVFFSVNQMLRGICKRKKYCCKVLTFHKKSKWYFKLYSFIYGSIYIFIMCFRICVEAGSPLCGWLSFRFSRGRWKIAGVLFHVIAYIHTHPHTYGCVRAAGEPLVESHWPQMEFVPTDTHTPPTAFTKCWGEAHTFHTHYISTLPDFFLVSFVEYPAPLGVQGCFGFICTPDKNNFLHINVMYSTVMFLRPPWETHKKMLIFNVSRYLYFWMYRIFVHKRHLDVCK